MQHNHSLSSRNTLRGLHAQLRRPQGKLVRAIEGEMFDVAVDIRRGSPSFGRWVGVTLSGENFRQLWIPPGFAHGFCVLSERLHVDYKCTDFYDGGDELAVAWNDPDDRHRLARHDARALREGQGRPKARSAARALATLSARDRLSDRRSPRARLNRPPRP